MNNIYINMPKPTLFDILALSPASLNDQDDAAQAKTIKQAYRRALLTHHPDKTAQAEAAASTSEPITPEHHFTVDQITEAYTVLSDTAQRERYIAAQQQQHTSTSKATFSASASSSSSTRKPAAPTTDTVVPLDALAWSGRRRLYYRACGGCGKARGFGLREEVLLEEEEGMREADEAFEVRLGCGGCGAELRVVVPGVEGGEEEDGGGEWFAGGQGQGGVDVASTGAQPQPQKKKKEGWGFRLRISLGLGGSVSVGR